MKSIRLLPVVIFAALALLVFKGIGLVTDGGYVLTGPAVAVADEGDQGGEATMSAAVEPVIADTAPMIDDTSPVMAAKVDSATPGDHAESSASSDEAAVESSTSSSELSSEEAAAKACADADPSSAAPVENNDGGLTDRIGNALANGCPPPEVQLNEHGDALPTTKDGNGHIVPLAVAEGDESAPAILDRLSERRLELDKREADIDMRTSLLAAAEKRLDERTTALEALQAQVNALVDEKEVTEDAGFKAVVSMYESMKPKDAAKIFDTLSLDVLVRVARAMNPRKMSPILAAMSPKPAQQLTTAFATKGPTSTVADAGENLAALPQIVGQ